jgi:hypothetical protein
MSFLGVETGSTNKSKSILTYPGLTNKWMWALGGKCVSCISPKQSATHSGLPDISQGRRFLWKRIIVSASDILKRKRSRRQIKRPMIPMGFLFSSSISREELHASVVWRKWWLQTSATWPNCHSFLLFLGLFLICESCRLFLSLAMKRRGFRGEVKEVRSLMCFALTIVLSTSRR